LISESSSTPQQHRWVHAPAAVRSLAIPVAPVDRTAEVTQPASRWLDGVALRRTLNVLVALVGIVLALPIMAFIALAIKITSPGPIIFKQTRVGMDRRTPGIPAGNWRRTVDHGGRLFTLYKFRTMRADSGRAQI
jgi:lipopolysaccharide/colanic/teichoic acid biosynthesis glycosyltransferase